MGLFSKILGGNKSTSNRINEEDKRKNRDGYVNIGKNIFPIIKNEQDRKIQFAENSNPLLTERLSDGIVICYLLDLGDHFEMISNSHLKQFGLSHKDVKDVAMRNLKNKINENCRIGTMDLSDKNPQSKPFYQIEVDSNLNPSIMLVDEFWDTAVKQMLNTDTVAVTIPAKNLIFFSDMKVMESFRTMRPIANQLYNDSIPEGIQLIDKTYIRKSGEWIMFLDTEEQLAELW